MYLISIFFRFIAIIVNISVHLSNLSSSLDIFIMLKVLNGSCVSLFKTEFGKRSLSHYLVLSSWKLENEYDCVPVKPIFIFI